MWDFHFSSKYQIKYCNVGFHVQIISFTAIFRIWNNTNLEIQISIRSISYSSISFSYKWLMLSLFNSCWKFYIKNFFNLFQSKILQNLSSFLKYFSYSSTMRTCTRNLYYSNWSLKALTNFSFSITI